MPVFEWRRYLPFIVLVGLAVPASAQTFNQVLVFGDSTADSGWWKGALAGQCGPSAAPCETGLAGKNTRIGNSIAQGHNGAPVGSGELMNPQILAKFFGLSADPANQAGGTNYAISGAVSNDAGGLGNLNSNPNLPSTAAQIDGFIAASGGHANSQGLYLISSGGNSVTYAIDNFAPGATRRAYLISEADALAAAVNRLWSAGAKYIIVPGLHGVGANTPGTAGNIYQVQLWSSLAGSGVNFVPADISSVVRYVQANPTMFGFTAATVMPGDVITGMGSACIRQTGAPASQVGWGQWCANTTTPSASYAYLASANAQQLYFYSDDQHFSAAGQKIEADYYYSLLVAPSQISMLAENAVKTRTSLISTIQNQIAASHANQGTSPFHAWVSGEVSSLKIDNYPGFPGDPSTPLTLSGGVSARVAPGTLIGAAVSIGHNNPKWSDGRGSFTQQEITGSLYAGYRGAALWGTVVASYGKLDYDVERVVPLGRASLVNTASTDGTGMSAGGQLGYDFSFGALRTGPVAGMIWQRVKVDGFTESGGVTSLGFLDQTRFSSVSSLGWRMQLEWGAWRPFGQVAWNHELGNTKRDVTAFLTSVTAPSFYLPAVAPGKDWGSATVGTTVRIVNGVVALAAVNAEFGEHGVETFGGQLGLNVRF